MIIRDETTADYAAIKALVDAAFLGHPHSNQGEARLVGALRDAGALTLSLVAEADGKLVGHIAFSPVEVDGKEQGWYGLGPVAVQPGLQGRGIGRALIEAGLARLAALGAGGCVLVGDPAFYGRFGFRADPRLTYAGVPPEYFMALALAPQDGKTPAIPAGAVQYHPAFDDA
ncbi:GNAT family N-acetyltransferase [Kaistia adipata]|uniref:GNAT family N-acetyltransferase n=1 Tax=Kaistia adipata TaxID=166954 RepID=UPI00040D98F3|nr:N-acetyltransferase [Kaistia adipata]